MYKEYPQKRRKNIRLKGYDYSLPGMYFITICTWQRRELFGHVAGGEMHINEFGRIVKHEWERSGNIRREIKIGEFVVMPNHIHGIISIVGANGVFVGANGRSPLQEENQLSRPGMRPKSISSFVAGFKSSVAKIINSDGKITMKYFKWQRSFYDVIIHDEDALLRVRQYIRNNPKNWHRDKNNML